MAGTVYTAMKLLLLSFIRAGVNGEDSLIFEKKAYDITFPCAEAFVCFHVWHFSTKITSDYIAIVRNGEIQTSGSQVDDAQCTLQINDLTAEDVGRHRCQQRPAPSPAPAVTLMPGKSASLQCILFSYVEQGHCFTPLQRQIKLKWVDEAGAQIQEDSRHQIKQQASCDVTLTVTYQSPKTKTFRCQMTVGKTIRTSVEFQVKGPGLKGTRGFLVEPAPEEQGRTQDMTGIAVGVVGCMVLTLLVAAFVVNRRANNQLRDEPCNTISTNNVMNADDVIYADIILPAGSDRVWAQECEPTEYACIRYK